MTSNMLSDLQVDVNGQETFSVSMKILASFSGKLRKMFLRSSSVLTGMNLKVILHDFPGGAEGFELVVRFCYNGGRIIHMSSTTPSDVVLLHSAAEFLEINEDETTKYFKNGGFLTWSELLDCLRQCQELSSSNCIVRRILNAVVEKLSMSSPLFAFSGSDSQFSSDRVSTNSSSGCSFQTMISWLHDLEFMTIDLFEQMLSCMIAQKLDHVMICSFLSYYYQKWKFSSLVSSQHKCRIIKVVITTLCSINGGSMFPFRALCDVLRACSALRMGRRWAKKVERMIGSRLDEATLDDLLVPSPRRNTCAYDVDMVLRLLRAFLVERRTDLFFVQRLNRVVSLMNSYLAEVAPDPNLGPCKFLALALGLPRESYDKVYEAIDVFFKVHRFVTKEEKMRMCSVLNHEKLSSESLVKLDEINVAFLVKKNLELMGGSSFCADRAKRESRKLQKKSENVLRNKVLCPRTGKSLPMFCSC